MNENKNMLAPKIGRMNLMRNAERKNMKNERFPPKESGEVALMISGLLAEHIRSGAAASGLTPQQYVLSLLWHNVPLKQAKPSGLPDCVQLVLHDIKHYYPSRPDESENDV